MALLIADPTPELCTGTEVMSAVVRGATIIVRPSPKINEPGRKSSRYERVGKYVLGSPERRRQGVLVTGTRASQRTPSALIAGPTARKRRGPWRAGRAPKRREKKMRRREPGIAPAPAAAAVYPRVPCWN